LFRAGRNWHPGLVVIDHYDVPVADVDAVESLAVRPYPITEVGKRGVCIAAVIVVVAQRHPSTILVAPPCRLIALLVMNGITPGVRIVPGGKYHGVRIGIDQLAGLLIVLIPVVVTALGDITSADQHEFAG